MKRLIPLILLLLSLTLPALAEELPQGAAALLEAAHPEHTLTKIVSASDPVIAVMSRDDSHVLCVAERKGGAWSLTVNNPAALRRGDLPSFLWEGGMSLYWQYHEAQGEGYVNTDAYHATLTPDGWSAVDLVVYDALNSSETTVVNYGGDICFTCADYDAEGNPVGAETQYPPYPQKALADQSSLADFDISRLPHSRTELDLQQLADALCPGYRVVDGAAGMAASFLADKADGTRVFVGCAWQDGRWRVTESRPLPQGTSCDAFHSGGENLLLHLPQDGDAYVTVSLQQDGSWQVSFIGREEWFGLGPRWIADEENRYCYGSFRIPLDVTQIDWSALPSTRAEAFALMDRSCWAAVNNPDPADRLHLREKADRSARSMGKYYNGTPVLVLEEKGEWVKADIFGVTGWMMKKYLAFGEDMDSVVSARPFMEVKTELTGGAALYRNTRGEAKGTVSESVAILGIVGEEYYHVAGYFDPGVHGYVKQEDLWPGNG